MPWLVDFVFLPDRDSGVRIEAHAPTEEIAVTVASTMLTAQISAPWAFEVVAVTRG
ncbi:hypothetical protein [Microbacterium arborescens]|uniref:hypothetical protein n=1 Tax=Microbacterium arborescens TaxID=33883 RepID=UPI0013B3A331|nr:hypothetical protein [Microbacterium arborescens]